MDLKNLYKLFKSGDFNRFNVATTYYLKHYDYYKKSIYNKLPNCVRFYISEDEFQNMLFHYEDFYKYDTDENIIIKEYCEIFLLKYSDHKKTLKIYKQLKESNPELFI